MNDLRVPGALWGLLFGLAVTLLEWLLGPERTLLFMADVRDVIMWSLIILGWLAKMVEVYLAEQDKEVSVQASAEADSRPSFIMRFLLG